MKFLIISNTCSKREFEYIQNLKFTEKISPQQNYLSMLISGLESNADVEKIDCISVRSVAESNCNIKYLKRKNESVSDKVSYIYTTVCTKNIFRNFVNFIEVYKEVKRYLNNYDIQKKDYVAIIDPLSFDSAIGACIALKGFLKIGIVTDLPIHIGQIGKYNGKLSKFKSYIKHKLFMNIVNDFQAYCYLTSAMKIIGKNKPYCVVEGMVPCNTNNNTKINKSNKKIVLYAGGLYEKFGINNLIQAANEIRNIDFELHLYGEGPCINYINEVNKINKNIKYRGVTSVDNIKMAEREATLLVNPRPCEEEYTKYSFPSKTLEYMSSGRPVLTTKLKGIPDDYYHYLYTIENNDVQTIKEALVTILNKPMNELNIKGIVACEFVNKYKNAKVQAQKIIKMVEEVK